MVYGSEAILSTDLDYGSPRVKAYNEQGTDDTLEDAMDQLNEVRDIALCGRQSTSKRCADITTAGCEDALSL